VSNNADPPQNNKMQQTRHGQNGASLLILVLARPQERRLTDDSDRYIPADIRRQVLLESGHACAIPTCQFPATEFAHIGPFAEVKKHEVSNIIALCPNHHTLYDQKKVIDRKAMRAYKLKLQFLNRRYTRYEMRLLTLLAEKPPRWLEWRGLRSLSRCSADHGESVAGQNGQPG
jgi:hypothetical protein